MVPEIQTWQSSDSKVNPEEVAQQKFTIDDHQTLRLYSEVSSQGSRHVGRPDLASEHQASKTDRRF